MAITNTKTIDPLVQLLTAGEPGGIEQQERNGQSQLAASSQLPSDGIEQVAKELGVTVIGYSNNDTLFCDVILPPGWRIVPTDHAMWSHLCDDAGAKRASIFYKAAFYDRKAFIRLE